MECSLGNAYYKHGLLLIWHTEYQLLPQGHFMDRNLFNAPLSFFTDFLIDTQQDIRDILTPTKQMTKNKLPLGRLRDQVSMILDFRGLIRKES